MKAPKYSLILLIGILIVGGLLYFKSFRYGSIYDYNGFEEETHLLKFETGYPEISLDDIIFEEWFETKYGEMINQSKFIEIWDQKSDDVGIFAFSENLDFEWAEAEYIASISAEKVAVVQVTFVLTSTGEFATRHCIWVTQIEGLHKASWWE